jgi:hypothetical protein
MSGTRDEGTAQAAPGFTLADHLDRLTAQLHDARRRCHALAVALDDVNRTHLAARREAERIGAVPPAATNPETNPAGALAPADHHGRARGGAE